MTAQEEIEKVVNEVVNKSEVARSIHDAVGDPDEQLDDLKQQLIKVLVEKFV